MADQNPNIFDNLFWLQSMADDARFILFALSHMETIEIEQTQLFINLFDSLFDRAGEKQSEDLLQKINRDAYNSVQDFRKFILRVLQRQIESPIIIYLHPAALNNMVNETEEFLRILAAYMQGTVPDTGPVDLCLFWTLNLYWHAENIAPSIEITYKDVRDQSAEYAESLNRLFMRSLLVSGLKRTGLQEFPAAQQLCDDTEELMTLFSEFINELKTLVRQKKILGILAPLYIDHIGRDICYFLTKLSQISSVTPPKCESIGHGSR